MRQTVRKNPAECTGCGACVSICPKQAITMQPDAEGFLYPKVDGEKCVSCDLCEKRCPAGREMPERPAHLFGAQAKDEALRGQSSSGGVFTLLAREVIRQGGVVFGAAFDEALHVEHIGAFDERAFRHARLQICAERRGGRDRKRGFAAEKGYSGAVFRHALPDQRPDGGAGRNKDG